MDTLHKDVKSVSGLFFFFFDIPDLVHEPEKLSYIIYLKNDQGKGNLASLHKFIKMFAMPYRMILVNDQNGECRGFILFWDKEDKEELDSTMSWIAALHSEWVIVNCQEKKEIPKITGYRIANNLFHAKRLTLQGEVL